MVLAVMKFRALLPAVFLFATCAVAWWTLQSPFWQSVQRIGGVMRLLHEEYVDAEAVDYERLGDAAIRGMVEALDPYSAYLPPPEFDHLAELSEGAYVGIGVTIERLGGRVTITRVFSDGPAAAAGVIAGDQVATVDGFDLRRGTVSEVSAALRGRAGEAVALTLDRPTAVEPVAFTLTRGPVQLITVEHVHLRADGIGYLQITQFSERTPREFRAALARLEADGMRGLIVDLRHNPGGLLRTAKDVAGEFFAEGELIVYVQGRQSIAREEFRAESGGARPDYPVAVLVNGASASGAEIVAGAWQDVGIATIVGTTTRGKGSVQTIYPFRGGGGLRQTTARYYLPSGRSIHEVGVEPDVAVEVSPDTALQLILQQRHAGRMAPHAFEATFEFAPTVPDAAQEAAIRQLLATAGGQV